MPEQSGNILRVGFDHAPPIPMQMGSPETGDFKGYEVSLRNELSSRPGVSLAYTRAFWSFIVEELSAGDLDLVCSAATVTEERAEQVDFCSPHLEIALSLVAREDSFQTADLQTARVGIRRGNDKLRGEINLTLEQMEADGTLPRLRKEWFGSEALFVG
jgi:ABC-type amino acid transport substrate-binding protein